MAPIEPSLAFRIIRISTKERPHDRFLTAQTREIHDAGKAIDSSLFFVVEITNPWFPNSQIGQTIINTIIREFRRGEHDSPLHNFEVALRKTNEVLSAITSSGETDWIGNLNSIIGLRSGPYFYRAQTGKARAYLNRGGRIMDVTEGLDDDSDGNPLSTYTNIISGKLEIGDRLLLGSSLLTETLSSPELKPILTEENFLDVGRNLLLNLQARKVRRINAFILEVIAGDTNESLTETLYADQSPYHLTAALRRLWRSHLLPSLKRSGKVVREQSNRGIVWTRDWLIPRVVRLGQVSSSHFKRHSARLGQQLTTQLAQIQKEKARKHSKLADGTSRDVQIHHYSESVLRKPTRKTGLTTIPLLRSFRLPNFTKIASRRLSQIHWQPRRRQLIILAAGLLVFLLIGISAQVRHNIRQKVQTIGSASKALANAQAAQQVAERAFVLGQKETAKTNFLLALTLAREALKNPDTATQARMILSQSQKLFDQLIEASRFEATMPIRVAPEVPQAIVTIGDQLLLLHERDIYQGSLADQELKQTTTLDGAVIAGAGDTVLGNRWFLPDSGHLTVYDPSKREAKLAPLTKGAWEKTVALSSFGATLYLLDPDGGQIWKHTEVNGVFGEAKTFFVNTQTEALIGAIDLAIDGDIFVLKDTGTIEKYTRGNRDEGWSLSGLPTPWDKIERPISLMTNADADRIFIFEGKTETHPARLLAFKKDGSFVAQLLFPNEWDVNAFTWDPVSKIGYLAQGKDIYEIRWDQ